MGRIEDNAPFWGVWQIEKLLGIGSYGRVYEIFWEDFGLVSRAALKVISIPREQGEAEAMLGTDCGSDATDTYYRSLVQNIIREYALMSRFKGTSYIVSCEDHQVLPHTDGPGWDILIRMELLKPLTAWAKEHPLTPADVTEMGVHICRALKLCSGQNIIHRDVKPGNIFRSPHGDYKLGDFGIARIVEQSQGAMSVTGTPFYMAPEICRLQPYDATVDLYSLGIVLYQLLNHNRIPLLPAFPQPLRQDDIDMALSRRNSGDALPPPDNAPAPLAAVIQRACAFTATQRWQSPEEMEQALLSWDKPLTLRNPGAPYEETVLPGDLGQKQQNAGKYQPTLLPGDTPTEAQPAALQQKTEGDATMGRDAPATTQLSQQPGQAEEKLRQQQAAQQTATELALQQQLAQVEEELRRQQAAQQAAIELTLQQQIDQLKEKVLQYQATEAKAREALEKKQAAEAKARREQEDPEEDFLFEIRDGKATITGYQGGKETIRVPSFLDGCPVVAIGESAFMEKQFLVNLILPPGLQTLGARAFERCKALTRVELPEGLRETDRNCFWSCSKLADIVLPASLESLGNETFWNCNSLTAIRLAAGNTHFKVENDVLFDKSGQELICYPAGIASSSYTLPRQVRVIREDAFCGNKNLTEVVLNQGLQKITKGAFSFCSQLQSITIPSTVTEIGAYAFSNCRKLPEISLPKGLISIAETAFSDCTSLTTILLPNKAALTKGKSFSKCKARVISGEKEGLLGKLFR